MNSEKSNGTIHLSEWREEIQCERTKAEGFRNVRPVRGLLYREECIVMLYELKKYLRSDVGSVPWQLDYYRGKYKIFFFLSYLVRSEPTSIFCFHKCLHSKH